MAKRTEFTQHELAEAILSIADTFGSEETPWGAFGSESEARRRFLVHKNAAHLEALTQVSKARMGSVSASLLTCLKNEADAINAVPFWMFRRAMCPQFPA